MKARGIYNRLEKKARLKKPQLAVLIDPDKFNEALIAVAVECSVSYFFVGGSEITHGDLEKTIAVLKKKSGIPVIIFPGDAAQVSGKADAILFLSLISGRNPEYLIGMQVKSAPLIRKKKLEPIPTGYMLIDTGHTSATQRISNTRPLPLTDSAAIVATAQAGELLGMKLIYLEAGSGAGKNVPAKLIRVVKKNISVPLIVGGGIGSKKQAKELLDAGADMIVVGNALEKDINLLYELKSLFD